MQFNLIVTGLDSISARRWINSTLVSMVDEENEESLKPLIDGGTEGTHLPICNVLMKKVLRDKPGLSFQPSLLVTSVR